MENVTKKVVVLGSTGMLGHVVCQVFREHPDYRVFDISYRKKLSDSSIICDVTNKEVLEALLKELEPDILINCVGVLIKGSQSNPARAIYINAYLPHFLSGVCQSMGTKLIHISTDCVFSGKNGPYSEMDYRDADDVYGRSKALGELDNDNDLTIRTSIIGPELKENGEGLLHWFLNQKGSVNGFTRAFWGGVTTLELAKGILDAIEKNLSGLVHFTNGEPISKFELLTLFNDIFERGVEIQPFEGKVVDKSLSSSKMKWNYEVPSYKSMLEEMKAQMIKHKAQYIPFYPFLA
jgi:dTDP-4-dehydrorhamnose reductase